MSDMDWYDEDAEASAYAWQFAGCLGGIALFVLLIGIGAVWAIVALIMALI
jgi:hypothetical protein